MVVNNKNNIRQYIILCTLLFSVTSLFSQEKVKVDWRSDISKIVNQGKMIELIGNVAFYHNGAVITCDTAYRYGEERMEGVGNVIINTDSTYIYGDRFEYNGETNIAKVFAPIIKTVDKDAVLYTRNMEFNTLTNMGKYYGGGTLTQNDNLMESESGDYYTQTRQIVLIGDVQMKNNDYEIKTDSVGFNLNNEFVTFHKKVDIWNHKGEFLMADKGTYDRSTEVYNFFDQAYAMTEDQEVWADDMIYNSKDSEATLNKNIQILDTTQQVLSFGDYGKYWSNSKRAELTLNPSVISYEVNSPDSSFISADSMILRPALDFTVKKIENQITPLTDSTQMFNVPPVADSTLTAVPIADSIAKDTIKIDDKKINVKKAEREKHKEQKRLLKEIKKKKAEEEKKARQEAKEKAKDEAKKNKKKSRFYEKFIAPMTADSSAVDSAALNKDSSFFDSLRIDKRNIKTEPDSSDYIIRAFKNVKIYRDSMQSVCDSLVLQTLDSTSHMFGKPIVWNDNNQITSDYIIIYSKNEQLYRAELYDFPIIAQQVPLDTSCYNQMKGKFMEVFFKNNTIDVTYIDGNAQTLYYKDEKGILDALFFAESASMKIVFKESQINRIVWYNDVSTILYPIDKIPDTQIRFFEGFKWQVDKRPVRREVFDRTILPSFRSDAIKIMRPDFKITQAIDIEKEKLIKEGLWRDRNEMLPFEKDQLINDGL